MPVTNAMRQRQTILPQVWQHGEFGEQAILCGACGNELTIRQYLACGAVCPACQAPFNPGCQHHYHLYFAT